jgi:WS/DGAT/MGAT family acyltransferase
MEQPTNLMMITGVLTLDDQVDFERLLDTVERRFLTFRRFSQKAVDGPSGAVWELDEDFDIRSHVRRVALPGKADHIELQQLVSELASTALDTSRPLWQFHLVENYQGGSALIVRIHHCIADGIALVQVFMSLTDPGPEPRPSSLDPATWTARRASESSVFRRLLEPARSGLDLAAHFGKRLVEEGQRVISDPQLAAQFATEATEITRELVHSLTLPDDPVTRLKGELGSRKQVAWANPLSLDEIKAVSKAFGCTVNDVLIAAVCGALHSYLVEQGDHLLPELEIRVTVPVNLRPLEHAKNLGNHFGLVFLSLPLGVVNPLERLYAVNERMTELKESKQAAVTFGFLAALGIAPSAVQKPVLDILSQKATAVLTNVPGPQQPLYLAGAHIREQMFWVPQNGKIGIGISILSYDGKVYFGLIADRKLIHKPDTVIARFRPEFEKLMYLAMMLPLDGRPPGSLADLLLERGLENLKSEPG